MDAMAPPFPSLAGAPPLTLPTSPSACLRNSRTPAIDSRLTAQTVLGMRLTWRTAPSDVRGDPRGSRNASLRKDGAMALLLIVYSCRKNFSPGTLWVRALASAVGYPLDEDERSEGESALSGYPPEGWVYEARVRRLSEGRGAKRGTRALPTWTSRVARSEAGRETVFR